MLSHAIAYARRGWGVFPCRPCGKTPLTKHGVRDATTDEPTIITWWERWPDANIGLACGSGSGLVVLDVDPRHGGDESLLELVKPADLPETVTVATGGGGHHYFFRENGTEYRNAANVLPGLDFRANGGYVIVPPSIHESGTAYVFEVDPGEAAPAPVPEWLRPYLKTATATQRQDAPESTGEAIPEGSRNDTLTRLAGAMRRRGAGVESIHAAVVAENARCKPPLGAEEVRRIAESVARYDPAADFPLTDTGNSERLVAKYGADLRYCPPWRKWLRWDGNRWTIDERGDVVRLATEVVRDLYAEAAGHDDPEQRKALAKWARASESMVKLKAMVERSQSMLPVLPSELDTDPWLLNVSNGVIDLRTRTFREARPEEYITRVAPVAYAPDAVCPAFEQFLLQIFSDDVTLVYFIQKALGYCLTGDTSEQVLFIAFGAGSNGKSTLLNLIFRILGSYALATPTEALMSKRTGTIPNDIARLKGVRYTTAMEVEEGRRLAEPLVKSLTGGDVMTARFLFGEFFDFIPQFKIWISTNHKPRVRGTDHAIWRRLRLIPFTVQIPDEAQDKALPEKLWAEAPGILNWLLDGVRKWQEFGLEMPPAVSTATKAYRDEMDTLAEFCNLRLRHVPGSRTQSSAIYLAYKEWAEQSGEKVMSQRWLTLKLEERGYVRRRTKASKFWEDVAIEAERI